jgi:LysM repeat protein
MQEREEGCRVRSNAITGQSPALRSMVADVLTSVRQPVSDEAVRKARLAAGALALGGAAAVLFGMGDAAEAKSAPLKSQVIRAGDSLSVIAERHGVSVKALAEANGLKTTSIIYAGKSLSIPTSGTVRSSPAVVPAKSYTVKRGDSLSSIASAHGVSVSSLASANNLSSKSIIVIGRTLTIPGVADSSPAAATVSKSSKSTKSSGGAIVVPSDMPANDPRWKLRTEFRSAAKTYGVPQSLLEAMFWNESGWQNHVTSGVGARGIGQIMPGTAQHINEMAGTKLDVNKPSDNIKMGAIYLKYLINENNGDYKMALASYYQGLGSVRTIGLYDDTKQYVRTITALQQNYFQ